MSQGICWLAGQIMPVAEAKISVLDHGLLYGDGVFEGIRIYHGKPFLLRDHLQRLAYSVRAIALSMPWSMCQISSIVEEVIEAYGESDGYVRLIVTRGKGSLGVDPRRCASPSLIVIADTLELVDSGKREKGVSLITASTRRLPPDGLDPRIKSLNYLNHILARIEANHAGADEAILLNSRGLVAEGTADNVFVVRGGEICTPPLTDGALAGITRQLILQLAGEQSVEAKQASLAPYDLYTADECFLTGTGAELIPVREIDGRPLEYCPGPVYKKLGEAFRTYINKVAEKE